MSETIVVVGANHAGTAAINTILDHYKDKSVVVFDRGSVISFLGCGMALWIGGQISGPDGLFYASKEAFEQKGATVHMETEVTDIDFAAKRVTARTKDGSTITQGYDKLILSTGSVPICPPVPGMELENVQFVKEYRHAQAVVEKLAHSEIRRVAVVGAGYIGVELAEAFVRNGRDTTLIDCAPTCLSGYYDDDFCARMADTLRQGGVQLAFGQTVQRIEGEGRVQRVVTDQGAIEADMVVFAIGFRANTKLGEGHLDLWHHGPYLVDRCQRTSDAAVFAVGDCATVYNNATRGTDYIALATNAVRTGIVAAHNACGTRLEGNGVQGSNGISIWGWNMFSTGLSLKKARALGYDAAATDREDWQKAAFIESGNYKTWLRVVYDKATRRILGAELASSQDVSMGLHMFSLAIEQGYTIDQLKLLDIFFLPHFNAPYNYITMAALGAQ